MSRSPKTLTRFFSRRKTNYFYSSFRRNSIHRPSMSKYSLHPRISYNNNNTRLIRTATTRRSSNSNKLMTRNRTNQSRISVVPPKIILKYRSNSRTSDRSRSRSESPVFPTSHHKKSTRHHGFLDKSIIPPTYNVNTEISSLAAHILKSGRRYLPPIDLPMTSGSTQWPSHIPIYVISINPTRQQRFKQRFRGGEVNFWAGTHGKTMDIGKLKRDGVLMTNELTRGEIGCYDSHQRLWEFMVKSNIPMAIICEDDVNLTGDSNQSQYFNTLLSELSNTNYDILFLSWFRPSGGSSVTSHTHSQWCFHQLWAYLITLDGSKKLLSDNRVKQMHVPVDVAMWESHTRNNVRNLVAFPPICLTVGEYSDTRNIR